MAEQKLDEKERLQLLLYDCHHLNTNKMIEIQRSNLSISKLLNLSKKEVGLVKSCKIYHENGEELTNDTLRLIKNNDALYISDGKILEDSYDALNLCVMGAGAVGKSAITLRFIQGQFVANYDPTIEDAYRKQIEVDGNQVLLDILDTAGQEDFECLRTQWMKNKDGFILVFSIIRRTSFNAIKEFYDGINEVYDDEITPPIILVGNKVDLDENHIAYMAPNDDDDENIKITPSNDDSDDDSIPQEKPERRITPEEAVAFGQKIGVAAYIETSARSGYNVENMVGKIVRHLINIKYLDQEKRGRKSTVGDNKKWWSKCQIL